jgi:tetratricopeptide (TPR) repeat protein
MSEKGKYVFIIHHFDEKGRERAVLLAGILSLLNIQTMFGENLNGKRISDGVQNLIESASLVVVLLTRDVKVDEDTWLPSQWVLQEITWAVAHHVPCLLLVEEGVKFEGGIAGDLEQIRFASDGFASTLVRIASQVQTLISLDTASSNNLLGSDLSDRVRLLILEAREYVKKRRWDEVLRVSEEALRLDSVAAQAALYKGVALLHLGQLVSSERFFLRMLEDFASVEDSLLSKVYGNLALIEEVRDAGSLNGKALRKQAKYLEKSLALNHKNIYTRAALVLCRVALDELNEASVVLINSLKYRGFPMALRRDVESKGAVGHRLLRQLPDWLYSLLFPTWHFNDEADDDSDKDDKLEN